MPTLVKAASSETLLPEARATRNRVFVSRRRGVARVFVNSGCWNMESTLFGFQAGMIFLGGGLLRNWLLASSENSLSEVLMEKPYNSGSLRAFLYTRMVLGLRFLVRAK